MRRIDKLTSIFLCVVMITTVFAVAVPLNVSAQGHPSGLISWWKFENNFLDSKVGNHGTGYNGISFTQGVVGKAAYFDGVDDYVDFGTLFPFERTDEFSFDFWIKQDSSTTGNYFVITREDNYNPQGDRNGQGYYIESNSNGIIQFALIHNQLGGTSNWLGVVGSTNLRDGIFHHVTITYDGSSSASGVNIYVDGELETMFIGSDTLTDTIVGSDPFMFGAREGATFNLFKGMLDEVAIYNTELSADDVFQRYSNMYCGPDSHWNLNEGSGLIAYDYAGFNHGTVSGPTWTSGMYSNGLYFDGDDDVVNLGSGPGVQIFGPGKSFSLEAWVYRQSSGEWHVIFGHGTWTMPLHYNNLNLAYQGDDRMTLAFYGDDLDTPLQYPDVNEWHHWVGTYDAVTNERVLYRDGLNVAQDTAAGDYQSNSGNLLLGAVDWWGYQNDFHGKMDEVAIYSRALTASEVYQRYLLFNPPPVADDQTVTTDEDVAIPITLSANDANGDPITYSIIDSPLLGTLTGTPPNMVYSPSTNIYGSDSFTFKANDGRLDSNIATVSVIINSVNDAPIAFDQTVTTFEDTTVAFTLGAADFDGDSLFYFIESWPAGGTIVGSTPNLEYTPLPDYSGTVYLSFKVWDGVLYSNIATVTIEVSPVNDAPIAYDQAVNTDEDVPLGITLSATDIESDPLTYSIVDPPDFGSLSGTAPDLTYTPNTNYHGSDSFTFKANDGSLDSNTAIVNIVVDSINDAPLAYDQGVTTNEDTDITITISGSDVDGDPITYHIVDSTAHGTLSGTPPSLTYSPDLNFFGTDSFTFKVNDGTVDSNVATVTITVLPINDAPLADDQSVTTNEDTFIAITLTGSDPEGDPLTFIVVSNPSHGTLSGTPPDLTYTPEADYHGLDSFTFKVNDGLLDSNIATVSITIDPVNDAPVADDQTVTIDEDIDNVIVLGASDVDGDPLTYSVLGGPSHGTLSGSGKTLTYSPGANYYGSDSFTFKVNDGSVDSNTATVSININSINDAPVADDQSLITDEDTALGITLTASDVEGDALTYLVGTPPTHGTLSGTAPDLTYTPDANYYGTDSFMFKANDGSLDSNAATISITINPVNDPPIAYDQSVVTSEDTAVAITLGTMDFDGDTLSYTIVSGPSYGTLSGTKPALTYAPSQDYVGSDSFTFKANDGTVDSNTATVSITVHPENDPPVADANGPYTADESSPITFDASGSTDVDGDTLEYRWDFEGDGTWDTTWSSSPTATNTWSDDYSGTAMVDVTDGVFTVTATASVTINNVPPTVDAGAEKAASILDTVSFSGSFTDPGTLDTHEAIWDWDDSTFSYGTISAGSVSGSHIFTAAGVYTVTLTVTDDDLDSGSDTCKVIIYEGQGTLDDPYKITNLQQLQAMKHDLSGHYILMNDIDASDTVNWNSGLGFEPIGFPSSSGDYGNRFTGTLDGKGYKITDLYINRPSSRYVGLIGYLQNGEVKNVGLENVDINGWYYTGGLAGWNYRGSIEGSYVTGSIKGYHYTGGLVGCCYGSIRDSYVSGSVTGYYNVGGMTGLLSYGGAITNSYAEGSVSGSWSRVGGLVGSISSATVVNSYATNSVSGSNWVGGLTGYIYRGNILYSYATGDIAGTSYLGGLVGQNVYGSIRYSYATGSPSGNSNLGGLVGKNLYGTIADSYAQGDVSGNNYIGGLTGYDSGTTTNSYSSGAVSGSSSVGGLIGHVTSTSTVSGSYWDTDTSGQSSSAAGTGKTTVEMKQKATFANWDYTNIWGIDEGVTYPYLRWKNEGFFAGGSGTVTDPYQIENLFQLQNINLDLGAHYILMNDIDASSTMNWNNGAGFEPIGLQTGGFSGSLDGDGYEITDLYINRPSSSSVGLFGSLNSPGEIRNVGLDDINIKGRNNVGGLVGNNNDGSITMSYAIGKINGYGYTGGLVGQNVGVITCSYSAVDISGSYYLGGLVGRNYRGTIENSYATGSVNGYYYLGGLVGYNYYTSTITNCYSTGSVTGSFAFGGLLGSNFYSTSVSSSYWDTDTSGTTKGVGSGYSTGIFGKTTAEMKQEATFTNWDFTDIWGIIEDETYPYLQWQNVPPVANCGGPYEVPEGTEITFDASNSFDVDGDPLEYRWDFDNDGTWDTGWSSDPGATNTWYDDYSGVVRVEVSDGQFTSTDTASVLVSNVNPKALISGSIGIGEDYIFVTNYMGQSYFVDIEADGSLTTPQLMDDKDYGTYGAGIGDFDNDGDLDALVGDFYNTWYFEKTGEGNTFAEPVSIESTPLTYSGDFAEADFNNDDNLDAIKANIMSGDMTLYSGNGDGTFVISTISGQLYTRGLDSGDFNNDGNMDLIAVTYGYEGKGYIYLGNGDGTFQTPTQLSLSTYGAIGICTGDFDNDGDDDLVTCSYPSMYYPNNGDGTFGTPTDLGFSGFAIAESDLNNDGNLDLVYTDFMRIYFRAGNGDGTFSLISTSVAPSFGMFGIASTPDIMLVDEGEDTPFTGTFTDPGYLDTHTATWDWGDGSPIEAGIVTEENEYPDATGEVTGSHAYADNGYYTIILTVSDDDGAMSIDKGKVKVLNVAPTASIDSVDSPVPGFILPDDVLEFTGSFTDPGTADTHTYKWEFGDGTVIDGASLIETHAYAAAGEYVVTLTVTDDDGASGTATVTVKVNSLDDATEQINDYIQDIPDDAFHNNGEQLQNALYEKLIENDDGDAVLQLIAAGLYEEALEKLRNDIRSKCDGTAGGNPNNDWITDTDIQNEVLAMIDALIAYLETLV